MRFSPSQTNTFCKIGEIRFILKLKLEVLDTATQKWSGVSKDLRVAPCSGVAQRWNKSMNMRFNETPISNPAQDQLTQHFVKSKISIPDDMVMTLGKIVQYSCQLDK